MTKKNHAKQSSNGRAGRVAAWAVARPRRRTGLLLTLVVALSIMLVMGFGLLPLTAGGGLRCDPPLRGATGRPKPNMPPVIQENVKSMCNEAAGSRWATVGVGVLVLFVVATAAVVTPADRFEKVLLHREANPLEAT